MHSFKDKHGALWVACSECERGGNGGDPDKCSCGGRVKRFNKSGCFSGTLTEKLKNQAIKQNLKEESECQQTHKNR